MGNEKDWRDSMERRVNAQNRFIERHIKPILTLNFGDFDFSPKEPEPNMSTVMCEDEPNAHVVAYRERQEDIKALLEDRYAIASIKSGGMGFRYNDFKRRMIYSDKLIKLESDKKFQRR